MLLGSLAPKINTLELPGDRTSVEVQFKPIFEESLSITKKLHREFSVNNNGDILFNVEYNLKITNPSVEVIDYLFELDGAEIVFYPHSDGGGRYSANLSIINQNKNNKYFIEELLLKIRATEYVSALRVISTNPVCGSATHRITDDITVDFNYDLDELTFTNSTVRLYHLNDLMVIEDVPFTLSVLANRLTINPTQDLEEIEEYFIFIDSSVTALNTVNLRADFLCAFTTKQRARFPESFIIDEQSDIVNMIEGLDRTPILVENPKHGVMFCDDSWILTNPEPLEVVNVNPDDNATGVSVSEQITIEFNKPLNIDYVTSLNVAIHDDFSNEYISGTLSLENLNKTIRFIPSMFLLSNRRYNIFITTDMTDIFGMSLAVRFESVFTTAIASSYSFVGAWTAGKQGYWVLGSDLINYEWRLYSIISSIDLSNFLNNRTDRLEWIDRIWPEQQTDDGIVTNLMSDCSHNAWFTNDDSVLITLSSFPYDGQTDVPITQKIHIIFNKMVFPSSIDTPYIRLFDVELGTLVGITFEVNGNSAIVTPNSDLKYNKFYNLLILSYIDAGVREDILDRYLTQDYSMTFKTVREIEKSIWVNNFNGEKVIKINSLNLNKVEYEPGFNPRGLLVDCSDSAFASSDVVVFSYLNTSLMNPFHYIKNLVFYIMFNDNPHTGPANYWRVRFYIDENYSDFIQITNYTYTYVENSIMITLDMSNISLLPYSKFRIVIDQDFCDGYFNTLQSAVSVTYDIYNETDSEDDSYIIGQGLMTAIPTPPAYDQQYKYNMNFVKTDWQYDIVNAGEFHADGFGWIFASYCKGAWIFTDIPWHVYIDSMNPTNLHTELFIPYPSGTATPFNVLFIGHSELNVAYHFNFPDEIGAAIIKVSTVKITDDEGTANEDIEEAEVLYQQQITKPFSALFNQTMNPTVSSLSGFVIGSFIDGPYVRQAIVGLDNKVRIKIELFEDTSVPSSPVIQNFQETYSNKTFISNESFFIDHLYELRQEASGSGDPDASFNVYADKEIIGESWLFADPIWSTIDWDSSLRSKYGHYVMRFGFHIIQFYDTLELALIDTWNIEVREYGTQNILYESHDNQVFIGEQDSIRLGQLLPQGNTFGRHYVKLATQPFVPRLIRGEPRMYSTKDPSVWSSTGFGGTQSYLIPPPPAISVSSEFVDFGTVAIGNAVSMQLVLDMCYIISPLTITVSSGFVGSQTITINPQPVNGISNRIINISFTPTDNNPVYGNVSITGGSVLIGVYGSNILSTLRNIDKNIYLCANTAIQFLPPKITPSIKFITLHYELDITYNYAITLDCENITQDISLEFIDNPPDVPCFTTDTILITDRGNFQKVINISALIETYDPYNPVYVQRLNNLKIYSSGYSTYIPMGAYYPNFVYDWPEIPFIPQFLDFGNIAVGNSLTKSIDVGFHDIVVDYIPDILIEVTDNFGAPYNGEFSANINHIDVANLYTFVNTIDITFTPTSAGFVFGVLKVIVHYRYYTDPGVYEIRELTKLCMLSGTSGSMVPLQQPILQKINNTIIMSSEFIIPETINKVGNTIEMS